MSKKITIINGVNLNLLGAREPEIYGTATLDDIKNLCQKKLDAQAKNMHFMQSNHEGALVDAVQQAISDSDALLINPGALGHYSFALHDALLAFSGKKVEVHISNVWKREDFRQRSTISPAVDGVIGGLGVMGYLLGLDYLLQKKSE